MLVVRNGFVATFRELNKEIRAAFNDQCEANGINLLEWII
jgi:hypothetical protein